MLWQVRGAKVRGHAREPHPRAALQQHAGLLAPPNDNLHALCVQAALMSSSSSAASSLRWAMAARVCSRPT